MGCCGSKTNNADSAPGFQGPATTAPSNVAATNGTTNDGLAMRNDSRAAAQAPSAPVPAPGTTGLSATKLFVAKYDYDARTDEDLSFKKGEILEIVDDTCGDWWRARSRSSLMEGYVPNNFVAEVKSLDAHE